MTLIALTGCGSTATSTGTTGGAVPDGGSDPCQPDVTDGTVCGEDQVCLGGQCVACASGLACMPAIVCKAGTTSCASGISQCVETSANAVDGTACGDDHVCSGGVCSECSAGMSCTPSNPCHKGTIECSSGSPNCADTAVNVAAGTSCGEDQICSPGGMCIACTQGAACDSGLSCTLGATDCTSGQPICQPTGPAADGTACDAGTCTHGACSHDIVVGLGTTDLSATALTPGRTCGEAVSLSVTALCGASATLSAPVPAGCLAPGDLVLLINEQGAAGATANIGNYEILTVDTVSVDTVSFTTQKTVFFGSAAGSDAGIGTAAGQQKVVLQRLPVFGDVSVPSGATLTAAAWNGLRGGVLAFRAAEVTIGGTVTVTGNGYRTGASSIDDGSCSDSLSTENGESISGPPTISIAANVGGAGGIGGPSNISFWGNVPLLSSAGHATAGQMGKNANGRSLGPPGASYGIGDGTRLTMGSGAGGNLTCQGGSFPPFLSPRKSHAGGIIVMLANSVTLSAGGVVVANGVEGSRAASSGGYVLLRANDVNLGANVVQAVGAAGIVSGTTGTFTNLASNGYIAVHYKTSYSGTTLPLATVSQDANLVLP